MNPQYVLIDTSEDGSVALITPGDPAQTWCRVLFIDIPDKADANTIKFLGCPEKVIRDIQRGCRKGLEFRAIAPDDLEDWRIG